MSAASFLRRRIERRVQDEHLGVGGTPDLPTAESLIARCDELLADGRYEEAIARCDEVVESFRRMPDPCIGRYVRAALRKKGVALVGLDRFSDACIVFDERFQRSADAPNPERSLAEAQEAAAKTIYRRAHILQQEEHHTKAIEAAASLSGLFGESTELPDLVIRAVIRGAKLRAAALIDLGSPSEAIMGLNEIVNRYRSVMSTPIQTAIADALVHGAFLLVDAELYRDAIKLADDMLQHFNGTSEPAIVGYVARALNRKAIALGRLGRLEESIAVDNETVTRFKGVHELKLDESVGQALGHKAWALMQLGRLDGAIDAWREMAERFAARDEPELCEMVDRALKERAQLLAITGQHAEALVVSDALVERHRITDDPQRTASLAAAMGARGAALVEEGAYEEAIDVLGELIKRFEDSDERELRCHVATALGNKSRALALLGNDVDAERVHDYMVEQFGEEALAMADGAAALLFGAKELEPCRQLGTALYNKAWILEDLGRGDEAMQTLDELIARLGSDSEPSIQAMVLEAREARQRLAEQGT